MKEEIGLGRGIVILAAQINRLKAKLKKHQIVLGHFVNRLDIKPDGWNVEEVHSDTGLSKKSISKIFVDTKAIRIKYLKQRDRRLRTKINH